MESPRPSAPQAPRRDRERDTLYARGAAEPGAFAFDADVARVFPDMIRRSVPGYATIVAMTGMLAGRHARGGTRLYDLGCSLGASTLAMRRHLRQANCAIVAIDNSRAMLERCRSLVAADPHEAPVELRCADILDCEIERASMVALNFTLQFIPRASRAGLIRKIHRGLRPGGALVLSEKIAFASERLNRLNSELHREFKRANGYSELEIAGKRAALENVLVAETLAAHRRRLRAAGFASCEVWFQCLNFASLVALK